LKINQISIFEVLIMHFADDLSRYEAKVAVAMNLIPFMD
jgi:hypothetical protein